MGVNFPIWFAIHSLALSCFRSERRPSSQLCGPLSSKFPYLQPSGRLYREVINGNKQIHLAAIKVSAFKDDVSPDSKELIEVFDYCVMLFTIIGHEVNVSSASLHMQ